MLLCSIKNPHCVRCFISPLICREALDRRVDDIFIKEPYRRDLPLVEIFRASIRKVRIVELSRESVCTLNGRSEDPEIPLFVGAPLFGPKGAPVYPTNSPKFIETTIKLTQIIESVEKSVTDSRKCDH